MFESITKPFIQKEAPSSVIPRSISISTIVEKYKPETIYKLASNENPLGVSPKALEAMIYAASNANLYPDSTRDKLLISKIALYNNLSSNNIFIACGAANVLKHICEIFIQQNDECIICNPAYPPYYFLVFKNNGRIIEVPVNKDQFIDIDAIKRAITKQTKIIFLCNPNNPTSTAISRDSIYSLLSQIPKNIIVIADEAYIDFADNMEELTLLPLLSDFPNLIIVRTFSKIYGLAAARLGYAIACPEIIQYLNKSVDARSLNIFAIEGGLAALDDIDFYKKTINNNTNERKYLSKELSRMGYKVYDSQANFLWVDFHRPAIGVYEDLIRYGIIIRGDFINARISIGTHIQNEALIRALIDINKMTN